MHNYYDPQTKIWTAPQHASTFNPLASVGDIVLSRLRNNPSKVIQICADDGTQVTSDDMMTQSVRFAINLGALGIETGDMISIVGRNNRSMAVVVLGCLYVGAPINCLDPSFEKDELSHMFGITKPKLVICERDNVDYVNLALKEKLVRPIVLVFGETLEHFFHLVETKVENYRPVIISDTRSHIALVVCSSGTTGLPKGVQLSHASVVSQLLECRPMLATDVVFAFSSMYWVSGFNTLLGAITSGATRVITEKPFEPEWQLELMERYKVTHCFSPPSHLAQMIQSSKLLEADLSSLRLYLTGGSVVSEEIRSKFETYLTNGRVRVGYGMTELSVFAFNLPDSKPCSVGRLFNRVSAKVIDENGTHLGPTEQGELLIKSPFPFLGYIGGENDAPIPNPIDSEGWFHTGDLGYFDNDSFLFIVDRIKETIKYRGYQISTSKLETFLQKETGILQVCVVGVVDLTQGTDLPAAVLVPGETNWTESRIAEMAEKKLPDYMNFRGGVYFVASLPMTPSGKIKRKEVQKIVEKIYFSMSK